MTQPNAQHDAIQSQAANSDTSSPESPKSNDKDSSAASNDDQSDARRSQATEDSPPDADSADGQQR